MAKGGSPTGEDTGVNRPPTLPVFPEGSLPSAAQPGLLIGILQSSDGTLALGLSRENGTWDKFIRDSNITS